MHSLHARELCMFQHNQSSCNPQTRRRCSPQGQQHKQQQQLQGDRQQRQMCRCSSSPIPTKTTQTVTRAAHRRRRCCKTQHQDQAPLARTQLAQPKRHPPQHWPSTTYRWGGRIGIPATFLRCCCTHTTRGTHKSYWSNPAAGALRVCLMRTAACCFTRPPQSL
jgi:hypothetical protein